MIVNVKRSIDVNLHSPFFPLKCIWDLIIRNSLGEILAVFPAMFVYSGCRRGLIVYMMLHVEYCGTALTGYSEELVPKYLTFHTD